MNFDKINSSYLETILKKQLKKNFTLKDLLQMLFCITHIIFFLFRKGFDSGRVGKAEMGEWPWHVSIHLSMFGSGSGSGSTFAWIRLNFGRLNLNPDPARRATMTHKERKSEGSFGGRRHLM